VDVAIREPIAGRYRLLERLGGGGMAEVYDAVDVRLDRPVAVKFLRDGLAGTPVMVERAEAEARLAARIHHPNVVAVLDAGRVDDTPFVVMERLPGLTLRDRLRDAPLDEEEIRSIGVQVSRGLAAAHELGVVHRDIKPSNVLAGPRGTWKIADFGIATWLAGDTTLTATGEIIGSAPYLAPERADGRSATPASDIYAVGVLLFEAATGRRPVERDDALATVMAIREGAREPVAAFRPSLDRTLRDAIERALANDPSERWPTATAFADALERSPQVVGTQRIVRIPASQAPPTEPLPSTPETAVLPTAAAASNASAAQADRSATRTERRITRRRASPSRALAIVLGAALAATLLLVALTFAFAGTDSPTGPARPSFGPAVPDELRTSMDTLHDAISP
jgi:serine/threonine protein kinase